jgi:hypothetical protein
MVRMSQTEPDFCPFKKGSGRSADRSASGTGSYSIHPGQREAAGQKASKIIRQFFEDLRGEGDTSLSPGPRGLHPSRACLISMGLREEMIRGVFEGLSKMGRVPK